MTIKQGDIVASDGRIETQQDGRKRYIEFDAATVLEVDGKLVTVNPVGKNAILICHVGDLLADEDLEPVEPFKDFDPDATSAKEGDVHPVQAAKPAGSLRGLQTGAETPPPAKKPTPRKAPAKKPPARRRRSS